MTDPRYYKQILSEDYPDIWQLWCDAVNAGDETIFLDEEGRSEEARKMWEKHEELWAEYQFAAIIVLAGDKDFEEYKTKWIQK